MSAIEQERPADTDAVEPPDAPAPSRRTPRSLSRGPLLLGVVVVWVVGSVLLSGRQTLAVARSDLSDLQLSFNDLRDWFDAQRTSNPVLSLLDGLSGLLDSLVTFLQGLFSDAAFPRPVPEVGWLGVVALAALVALAVAGWRLAVATVLVMLCFGYLGYWQDSIDLLIITLVSVAIVTVAGIPLGAWMGRSPKVTAAVTPLLDALQTLPSFVYLLPVTLVFGIGAAPAVVVTVLYAFAPVVRVTAHGVRTVSEATVEAAVSQGSTRLQVLRKVQLPMAKQTIIVGLNQSIMAALSIATIAAFISSPGLGVPVITALQSLDVGTAFVAGLAIVVMAVWLDRLTTAAVTHTTLLRTASQERRRLLVLAGALVLAIVAVYYSRLYSALALFPDSPDLGAPIADAVSSLSDTVTTRFADVTNVLADAVSYGLLNPLQHLVAESPWWLSAAALLGLSYLLAGVRSAVTTLVAVAVIVLVGVWHDAMVTLATTLVATVIVMVIGLVLGVLMARSRVVDTVVRPLLDAGQVVPPFVYLIPVVALFGATRFSAIVAATVYGVPVASKLVCDALRSVSPASIEAATSTGATRRQLLLGVQLPMARSGLALAANQGLLYVFSVVVIGGLVGAGGLGYLAVAGFSRGELFGKGLAAGIAIVALAIMLDRMFQTRRRPVGP